MQFYLLDWPSRYDILKTSCITPLESLHFRQPSANFGRKVYPKFLQHLFPNLADGRADSFLKLWHLAFDIAPQKKVTRFEIKGARRPFERTASTWSSENPLKNISKVTPRLKLRHRKLLRYLQVICSCNGGRVTWCITQERWCNQPSTRHGTPNRQL